MKDSFWMGTHYTEEYSYVSDILDALLLAQSTRWVKVVLCIPGPEIPRLHCIKGRIPLLQYLVFSQTELEEISMPIDLGFSRFVDAFEDSQSLSPVEIIVNC